MTRFFATSLLAAVTVLVNPLAAEPGQAVGLAAVKNPAKLGFDVEKLDAIFAAQKKLITDKLAPSNAGLVVRKGQVVYHRAAASGLAHDRAVTDKTVFRYKNGGAMPRWTPGQPLMDAWFTWLEGDEGKGILDAPLQLWEDRDLN